MLSDQHLIRAYLGGDRAAFDALFRRYASRVYATAWRLTGQWEDAEDTLREVFLRLATRAATLRTGAALSAWLYRTAVNCATDCLRRRREGVSLDGPDPAAAHIIAVESLRRRALQGESDMREEWLEWINALVPRLPERQAQVFVLRGFQGLAYREIAEILKCSESSAKTNYCVACGRIRQWIAREGIAGQEQSMTALERQAES
jgi:RNA polymerase sigma-70 factor, ECF subfamily